MPMKNILFKILDWKNNKQILEIADYDSFEHVPDLIHEELRELIKQKKIFTYL